MIRLAGVVVNKDGEEGQVQITLVGEDGTPMRYEYSGEVYTMVDATSVGYLKVFLTVSPTKHDTVGRNLPKSLFNG